MAVISALYIYPVKSLAGFSLSSATLSEHGLRWRNRIGDRQWMLVLPNGRFVTQRQWPQLARIKTELTNVGLVLHKQGMPSFHVSYDYDPQRTMQVTVWRDEVLAFDEGDAVAQWLGEATEKSNSGVRLVRFGDESERPVSAKHLWDDESSQVAFADGYPILVANTASLDQFNRHLRAHDLTPLNMNRFRANVILTDTTAWQENSISEISAHHNQYQLGLRKPCERCPMITVDQQHGSKPEDGRPLKSLIDFDCLGNGAGAYFGQNAIVTRGVGSLIEVGDDVRLG
ncbi:MOSC domain-containing protein [Echinimonas agarilytica]|uniref:MOSC N-terminal beta barrel domain-containing protein n=1 Tax=Echinimonas agarilytica TaxID=1215918 RepID=A0AA41W8P8_9GAMM|nr:MOSC N-terminal beta barrel domain-containing protein [Echinimonas agarilytica]MCM2681342.1 MOSC N-terminal beta barrel domain-containing protein [Echinimonas agarilytica]